MPAVMWRGREQGKIKSVWFQRGANFLEAGIERSSKALIELDRTTVMLFQLQFNKLIVEKISTLMKHIRVFHDVKKGKFVEGKKESVGLTLNRHLKIAKFWLSRKFHNAAKHYTWYIKVEFQPLDAIWSTWKTN